MKKKINRRMVGIAVFSILVTLAAMTAIFYASVRRQAFSDLAVIAEMLSYDKEYDKLPEDLRVTVVEADGTVYFDSAADAADMENHLDRPEIRDALEYGEGKGSRMSDTISASVLYYAVRLSDGRVLRVGRQSASVVWLLVSAIPAVAAAALLLTAVCMAASHYLTNAILSPIAVVAENIDRMEDVPVYGELAPFLFKIRSQHEEILAAASMRQEFTANVTHELKTPLSAVLGYAELMEAGMVKEEDIRHFSHEIGKNAKRLLALINDIIKLSRLDEGGYPKVLEMADLAAAASDTVEMLAVHAKKMNVRLSYNGCSSAKLRIGKEFAEELAYNLIENAIRYNKPGGAVEVSVEKTDWTITLAVSDTGIGIPEEHCKRIFERFYRVDQSRSKELGGTGLGLAIVKHICSLTGGDIVLSSRVGEGTDVRIRWDNTREGNKREDIS